MSTTARSSLATLTRLGALIAIAAMAACSEQEPTQANLLAAHQAEASPESGRLGAGKGAVFVTTNATANKVKAFRARRP